MANKNAKPPKEHQFKPGQSGNPDGRKGYERSMREYAMDLAHKTEIELQEVIQDASQPVTKRKVAEMILKMNADGVGIVSVIEQLEGKPAQPVNVSGNIGIVRVQRGERQFKPKSK